MLSFLVERKSLQDRYFITGIGLFLVFHQMWKTMWKSGKLLYRQYISWYSNRKKVMMWKSYPR
ncbi:hypothetical protein CIAN88_17270 [[Clostridium] innocuum]|uniref:Uncharacterized protein n=1 Tax=Clostridium innocuum TaxID=1522 RepID=A0A099I264_CLOIN|nr:hypothetical protein CIAN88_17270 [[Clostridium] innocuum]